MANGRNGRMKLTLEQKIEKKSALVLELEGKLATERKELADLKKAKDERDLMEFIKASKEDPGVLLNRLKGTK